MLLVVLSDLRLPFWWALIIPASVILTGLALVFASAELDRLGGWGRRRQAWLATALYILSWSAKTDLGVGSATFLMFCLGFFQLFAIAIDSRRLARAFHHGPAFVIATSAIVSNWMLVVIPAVVRKVAELGSPRLAEYLARSILAREAAWVFLAWGLVQVVLLVATHQMLDRVAARPVFGRERPPVHRSARAPEM